MSSPHNPGPGAQIGQVLLRLQYQDLARRGVDLPTLADVEFRCHSQNGEDGILLYIFALLGTTNRKVVEICAGDGIECNAATQQIFSSIMAGTGSCSTAATSRSRAAGLSTRTV